MTRKIMTMAAACLFALPLCVNAGDLTVDNLTLYGKLEFANGTVYPASGGTVTTNGNYVIHTFTTVGTTNFIVSSGSLTCSVLVVAGGAAGGGDRGEYSGGGGAGGVCYQAGRVVTQGTYSVIVGAGSAGVENDRASNGSNSCFDSIVAFGGGAGGAGDTVDDGANGGSGGGAGGVGDYGTGGSATQTNNGGATGYGNPGGSCLYYCAGGAGGAARAKLDLILQKLMEKQVRQAAMVWHSTFQGKPNITAVEGAAAVRMCRLVEGRAGAGTGRE